MPKLTRRDIGPWPLLFTGLGSIIGSGWLFGAARAAAIAGPGAIFAWIIGAVVVLVVAAVSAELGGMFPVSGGMVRYARVTHGGLVGFLAAWANWLSVVSTIAVEAEASIQYMSSWPYAWTQALYRGGELSPLALVLAGALVVVYFLVNYWSVAVFAKSNATITVFKLVVPTITGLALIYAAFHMNNVTGHVPGTGGFLPFGGAGVLTAVATSGIVFAFNGFQNPLSLAGEARDPDRSIPFAVIGSVAIAVGVYLLLQIAFLGAIDPARLQSVGWAGLGFSSPFAQLAMLFGLGWLAVLLYFDAFVSPSGTGITYTAVAARMVLGMQRNGTAPQMFGQVDARYGVPRPAMWFNLLVAFAFLYFFRGWGPLMAVISVSIVITYLMVPVAALTLRARAPGLRRPVRLPGMGLVAPLAFVFASELLYWARWPLTGEIILLLAAGLPIYAWYQRGASWMRLQEDLRAAGWFVLYLALMAGLSWIGSTQFGGLGVIPYGWDMLVVAALALVFCLWGARSGLPEPALAEIAEPEADAHTAAA